MNPPDNVNQLNYQIYVCSMSVLVQDHYCKKVSDVLVEHLSMKAFLDLCWNLCYQCTSEALKMSDAPDTPETKATNQNLPASYLILSRAMVL